MLSSAQRPAPVWLMSSGMDSIAFLADLLGHPTTRRCAGRQPAAVAGWGAKDSGQKAIKLATRLGVPCWRLEDGFLRSFGTGEHFPPLSLVVDDLGIYYDSTRPSALEALLESPADVLAGMADDVTRAKALVLAHRLSKYNHAPDHEQPGYCERSEAIHAVGSHGLPRFARNDSGGRVLVIDQTAGDMSVLLGGASADTFAAMLAAARAENPQATIYVKTHPEVSAGRKNGYLAHVQDEILDGQRTVVLRRAINPLSLIGHMDRVYVVTSTMGFEALLAGKPVSVFGMPWYAGWAATDDRQTCARRTRQRSVNELFAAAYFHYARYLNPVTHQRGTIFDVIEWLVRQRAMAGGHLYESGVA